MTISSQEKHNFHSVHAFTHIRQHYFSKYWGDQCMGGPPTSSFGGPVPPRSPPLYVAYVGLRLCSRLCLNYVGLYVGLLAPYVGVSFEHLNCCQPLMFFRPIGYIRSSGPIRQTIIV